MISGRNEFANSVLRESSVQIPNIAAQTNQHLTQLMRDMEKHEQEAKKALEALKSTQDKIIKACEGLKHTWEQELKSHGLHDELEVTWDEYDEMGDGSYSAKLEASWAGGDEAIIKALEASIEHTNQHDLPVNIDFEFSPSEPHGSWFITLSFPWMDFDGDLKTFMENVFP